jgi:hypothetical protein
VSGGVSSLLPGTTRLGGIELGEKIIRLPNLQLPANPQWLSYGPVVPNQRKVKLYIWTSSLRDICGGRGKTHQNVTRLLNQMLGGKIYHNVDRSIYASKKPEICGKSITNI